MIEIFTGRLGGGKTYYAVMRIRDALAEGRTVATNIELNVERLFAHLAEDYCVEVPRENLILYNDSREMARSLPSCVPCGTQVLPNLIVLDEAHLFFNARDWKTTHDGMRSVLEFLTQSRKAAIDCIFITQHQNNLDAQFVRLAQYVWSMRDLSRMRIEQIGVAYPFNQILASCFDYDGKTLIERRFLWKDKTVFGLFTSEALLTEIALKRTLGRPPVRWKVSRKRKLEILALTTALVVVGLALWG